METKIKTYGLIIGVILFIALLAGLSYAYYESYAENKSTVSGTAGCFSVDYAKGNNINGDLILFDESKIINNNNITIKEGMQLTYVNAKIKEECTLDGYLNININVRTLKEGFISGDSIGALKYVIVKYSPNAYTNPTISTLKDQTFEITKSGSITSKGELTILSENLSHTTTNGYLIIFYIDGNLASNDIASNTESNFSATVSAIANQGKVPLGNAAKYITSLYTNATKTKAQNNGIDYNYASSESLMNDRLGGTTSSLDGGNIRYYGASPNNYIYFNCSDYSNQTSDTCELWRIIGVFDDKVKIMKNQIIGKYSWDNKNTDTGAESDYGKNEWTTARLMKLLNPSTYYTSDTNDNSNGQSLYWNAESGTCFSEVNNATISCDFTSAGIKNDATRNKIAEVTWNLGGWNSASIYSNQIYGYERGTTVYSGRSTTWSGKVALPYPSDYGYAVDFNKCSKDLYNYDDSTCTSNNWMKSILASSYGWLLTPNSVYSSFAWSVLSGDVSDSYNGYMYRANGVAPVLYLGSDESIESGDGSSTSPYTLSA